MVRLYSDEDFSFPLVEELRKLGHDVLTAQEAGHSNQGISDSRVLAFAIWSDRAVLTFNRRHFIDLHRLSSTHCGIVVCTRDNDVANLACAFTKPSVAAPTWRTNCCESIDLNGREHRGPMGSSPMARPTGQTKSSWRVSSR